MDGAAAMIRSVPKRSSGPERVDAGRNQKSRDLSYTFAVALVALLPRLFVAIAWAKEPVWDGHYYHFGATRIAEGLGYSEDVIINGAPVWKPWTHYPVGYSALLGAIYRVLGSGLWVAPLVNVVIGTLLVVAVHRLSRYVLNENRSRIAAALVALHPGLIAYAALVMTEQLAALAIVSTCWVVAASRRRWVELGVGGLLLGFGILVRPAVLLIGPVLALFHGRPWVKAVQRALAVTAIAIAVVLPWTVRNCLVMDGCAFVSTNAGWNLAIGAISDTGRFQTLHASDGCRIVTGQVQQDRCWMEVGLQKIVDDPGRWLGLIPKKLGQTYDHESFPIEYLHEASPQMWPELRRIAGRQLLTWYHWLLIVAAGLCVVGVPRDPRRDVFASGVQAALGVSVVLFGLWSALRDDAHQFFWIVTLLPLVALLPLPGRPQQGPVLRVLLGTVAVTTITHAIFFGDDRYHLVLSPILCVLAAAALRASRVSASRASTSFTSVVGSGRTTTPAEPPA